MTVPDDSLKLKRKRKAEDVEDEGENELEIDLDLPEPLSKKAARKAKKVKDNPESTLDQTASKQEPSKDATRSQWGVWVGNLPWTVAKADLRTFFCKDAAIEDEHITRVHMPAPSASNKTPNKPKNKGFAYLDFTTEEAMLAAIALSEQLIMGRRVLIKKATSFEGRPEKTDGDAKPVSPDKPPSKRIFVGNLSFDATKDDLETHFGQCGEVVNVHMATFEDSGKCKGYAWVTFAELEASSAAVRGWISVENEDEDEAPKTRSKTRKMVNKLEGRTLRCEFAEDASVRYKRRFGQGTKREDGEQDAGEGAAKVEFVKKKDTSAHERRREKRRDDKERPVGGNSWETGRRHATMGPKPAKASGALVKATGKKISL
ncbi:hypothetical protein BT63DRAFT_420004, partial [Microthyrium microscopicum]